MNIQKMLKQAQQMQAKMQSAQADLAEKTVEATAGGGKVTVTANGGGDILSVKINPTVVDAEDVEMLEDLILSGVRKAQEKAKSLMQTEMEKVTGGMPGLPGMGM
ncbi:MAG: DNA-binding YbaB/EbfC family protein [Verrucomicrobiales bacterium]|jgi:DNA-binding YbaB/EbfC family protein